MGVKLVLFKKKLNAKLIEVPIYFKDRNKGKSKIPKLQIFISFFDLILIFLKIYSLNKNFIMKIIKHVILKICENHNCGFLSKENLLNV